MTMTTDTPFDSAWYEASRLTLGTLVPGVDYTHVQHNDSSDHGRSECFFADQNDAERYVTRLKAASASGSLDEHFQPWPASMDLALLIFTVTRRV